MEHADPARRLTVSEAGAATTDRARDILHRRRRWYDERLTEAPRRWTVRRDGAHYQAVDGHGQPAGGVVWVEDAVPDLLAALSDPPGRTPVIRWTERCDEVPEPAMDRYLRSSTAAMAAVCRHLRAERDRWDRRDPAGIDEQIAARAAELDRIQPLFGDEILRPFLGGLRPGQVFSYEWIDPASVVGTSTNRWNGFADHRPHIVGRIVGNLLTTEDLDAAVRSTLDDGAHVHLQRLNGPAGPIHWVTVNGGHRTHALRILDAPLIVAEVETSVLPLWVPLGGRNAGERMARGLLERGLVAGRIVGGPDGRVLELEHAVAPWLLFDAVESVRYSAAYERVYPGVLAACGVPEPARRDVPQWRAWLTGRP